MGIGKRLVQVEAPPGRQRDPPRKYSRKIVHECKVNSWEEFEDQLRVLREQRIGRKTQTPLHVSELLFRGQRDHTWKLSTTLERQNKGQLTLRQYYRLISAARPQIETLTETLWTIPSYQEYEQWLRENEGPLPGDFPGYDYMVYLRHHGFPSPLLDWSRSPYVAAYFAFAHAASEADRVSIYVYWEYPGSGKVYSGNEPRIHGMGPYVRTHRRHFLQQSEYTICVVRDREWQYAPHEAVFARDDKSQDALWKFDIPAGERLKVLKYLEEHNINAFSLFGSEESLMETIALRELHLRDRGP